MSLQFLGQDIGRWLKIWDAGVLELADEADSKSVGLITRAGSTPATGTTPNGSQTLDITGFAGFSLCSVFLCMSLAHQQICRLQADFRRDIGGTSRIKRRDIRLKSHWLTQPSRWNSGACKCLRWSKCRCDPTTPEFLSGLHRLRTTGLHSYAVTV